MVYILFNDTNKKVKFCQYFGTTRPFLGTKKINEINNNNNNTFLNDKKNEWYYNTVIPWVIYYFVHAFSPKIPWSTCDNWWNTDHCIVSHKDRLTLNKTAGGVNQSFTGLLANGSTISYKYNTTYDNQSLTYNTAAYEFWEYV